MFVLFGSSPYDRSASTPLTASSAPTASRPPRKLPVHVRTSPMVYGPRNPPRLARELINAMPAAAEVPLSISVVVAQNGPFIENAAIKVMLRKTTTAVVEVE